MEKNEKIKNLSGQFLDNPPRLIHTKFEENWTKIGRGVRFLPKFRLKLGYVFFYTWISLYIAKTLQV